MCYLGRPFSYRDNFPTMLHKFYMSKTIKQIIAMRFNLSTIIYVAMYKLQANKTPSP